LTADAGSCSLAAEAAARWIAFDSDLVTYNRDIYLIRADKSQTIRLTSDPSTESNPAFSNSGTKLAFASDRSGSMQVHVMDLSTHAVTQLTTLSAGADQPNWSRDDTQIVFHSGASVYVMGSDGSNPRIVGTGLDTFNAYKYPAMSADGTQVVFDRNNEIDALKLDGTGFRYVVQNTTTRMETPAFSPDGVNIAFGVVQLSSVEQIAVAPFAGSTSAFAAQTVTPASSGSARRPAWGPAGVIAFERGLSTSGSQISTAAIALSTGPGAATCDLVGAPADNRNPNWAPAGFQPK
jgi:Tol biopolymer transport system component